MARLVVRSQNEMTEGIQYIINTNGDRLAVIVPIKQFESMLTDLRLTLEDYEREASRPLLILLNRLRASGEIEL